MRTAFPTTQKLFRLQLINWNEHLLCLKCYGKNHKIKFGQTEQICRSEYSAYMGLLMMANKAQIQYNATDQQLTDGASTQQQETTAQHNACMAAATH